jgi:hypothetical protein
VPVAVALAAVSLLLPWALAFDPQAWVVWGRDASRFALDTSGGPSWKPLPVVVTTPLALTGDPAPALWLVVARAGGLLALAGAWVLAARLGGTVAGVAAALVMALSPWWLFNTALGNSEGLLAASALWAVVAHLAGHRRAALALGTAAALLRPEVWPFLGLYGLWLWRNEPAARAAVVAAGVVVPVLWIGPDVLGIGGALSASRAARGEPSIGSAALEDVPGLAVLADAVALLTVPATLAAVAGTIAGRRLAHALAAAALAWIAIVDDLREQMSDVGARADRREALPQLVSAAGGRDAIVDCAPVRTAPDVRPLVAWELDISMLGIDRPPEPPVALVRWRPHGGGPVEPELPPGELELLGRAPYWEAWGACRVRR